MAPTAVDSAPNPKTSVNWADDVEDDVSPDVPRIEEFQEPNGIRVIVEYKTNADGKKVKVTRRIKRTLVKSVVNVAEAERKKWDKFGQEKGRAAGPHSATTTVGENVMLKMSPGNKKAEPEKDPQDEMRAKLANKTITCRLCKGEHFTSKCPYRDTLEMAGADEAAGASAGLEGLSGPAGDLSNPAVAASSIAGAAAGAAGAAAASSGKYVPPSMRAGARGAGERMGGPTSRDDMPTLRVTNLSEYAEEDDLRAIFGKYGRVTRVYVGRDRETGECKGFAFVSFESHDDARRAMEKVNGKGYDNLILSVSWSEKRKD